MSKYLFVKSRLIDVGDIIDKRSQYNRIIQELISNLPNDTKIETVRITEKKVNVSITAKSLASINSFIDSVVVLTSTSKIFSRAVLENLVSDTTRGLFTATINLDTT